MAGKKDKKLKKEIRKEIKIEIRKEIRKMAVNLKKLGRSCIIRNFARRDYRWALADVCSCNWPVYCNNPRT